MGASIGTPPPLGPSYGPRYRRTIQGYLAHTKHPPPWDHHRSLGMGLLSGLTWGVFPISEVPLLQIQPGVFFMGGVSDERGTPASDTEG